MRGAITNYRLIEQSITFAVTCPTSADKEHNKKNEQQDETEADHGTHNDDSKTPPWLTAATATATWRHNSAPRRHRADLLDVEPVRRAI